MKQQLRNFLALSALAFFLAAAGLEAQDVGPEVGSEIKDFVLTDQAGEERRFSELLADGPVAVVFHRSADW